MNGPLFISLCASTKTLKCSTHRCFQYVCYCKRIGYRVSTPNHRNSTKNTAYHDSRYKNLALSSKQSQCMKVGSNLYILLLQVSSHDLEPTYILAELKNTAAPVRPVQIKTYHQIFDPY
jgi:hypothetical protein